MNDKPAGGQHLCKRALTKCPPWDSRPNPGHAEADVQCVLLHRGACEYPSRAQPALCLVHHEAAAVGHPLRLGRAVASISELVRSCSCRAETEGMQARLLGLRRGECAPPKSHLVRFGEIKPDTYSDRWQKKNKSMCLLTRHIMWPNTEEHL